jgi:hypothetical protein
MGSARAEDNEDQGGTGEATDVLNEAIAVVPTVFGKLVWVSSLRVAGPDGQRYPDLERLTSPDIAASLLLDLHQCLFESWLALSLPQKSKDFTEYLEALRSSDNPQGLLFEVAETLIPPGAKPPERLLFETDFAVVLELVENTPR